jgi:hypothetical protein
MPDDPVTTDATSSEGGKGTKMKLKRHKILGGLALAVASVAVAAPVAQADDWYNDSGTAIVRPDDRAGARGPIVLHRSAYVVDTGYVRPDDRAVRATPVIGGGVAVTPVVRPDDRADRVSPVTVETAVRPDDRGVRVSPVSPAEPVVLPDDRAGTRGPGAAPAETPAHIVISPTGFDWTDAGIGAGMAFGLILLGSGMLLVARRHRKPTAAV